MKTELFNHDIMKGMRTLIWYDKEEEGKSEVQLGFGGQKSKKNQKTNK